MRIFCEITQVDLDGDYGTIEGVSAVCSKCGYCTESFGTSDSSINRCLVLMREECPAREKNFYKSNSSTI